MVILQKTQKLAAIRLFYGNSEGPSKISIEYVIKENYSELIVWLYDSVIQATHKNPQSYYFSRIL